MFGETCGTSTLARKLKQTATDVYEGMDDGVPWDELREDAKRLMEGAIVLWERMMEEDE